MQAHSLEKIISLVHKQFPIKQKQMPATVNEYIHTHDIKSFNCSLLNNNNDDNCVHIYFFLLNEKVSYNNSQERNKKIKILFLFCCVHRKK